MKKIPTVFVRDFSKRPHLVTSEVMPGCEWVLSGEGVATRKWDGTCVLVRAGKLYARYDAKHGKAPPDGFKPAQPEPDTETGHWPGWILVEDQPQYKWHRKTWDFMGSYSDGSYELVGPKINGNPEGYATHDFIRHGNLAFGGVVRTFEGLRQALADGPVIEGLVFHHEDGRMAKIKRKDYGLPWPVNGRRDG